MEPGADPSTAAEGPAYAAGDARHERRARAALLLVFLVASLTIYRPAFPGGPISDDYGLLLNPWVTSLDAAGVAELFDPRSQATLSLRNYAPIRPLVQALEWRLFGENGVPYHAVNAALHALCAWLLVLLLCQAGVARIPAALGGAFFLAHPAQVESIAWMSQVWTPLALCFGIAGLLAQRRRPALACALFVLALLTRPTAVCVLPVAALRAWCWRRQPGALARGAWLAAAAAAFAAIAAVEFWIFSVAEAAARAPLHPDALVRLRTIVAIAGRYLARAATGHGVSAFQEVEPAVSWLDPWWLLGLAGGFAMGARALVALARDREEAAFWAWAPAAFLPVSQLFPFLYPMADRYLYFLLPGLVGGALLAGADLAARLAPSTRRRVAPAAVAAALATIAALGAWSHARAGIWVAEDRVLADAAHHHPRGTVARLLEARRAAASGDVDGAVAALEAARARGWDFYFSLLRTPAYEPVRRHPRFQALLETFAAATIETVGRRERVSQIDLRDLAEAHRLRGETAESIAALERALALGGPLEPELRAALAAARARLRREDTTPAPP